MRSGRPKSFQITLTREQRGEPDVFSRSRSLPHGPVRRANIILLTEQGLSNTAIAAQPGVSNPTVAHWCKRYLADGIDGLYDLPSGGRPRTYSDDEAASLMQRALDERPAEGTYWSVRSFAGASGLSRSTVQAVFQAARHPAAPYPPFQAVDGPVFHREGTRLVRKAATLPRALHPNLCLLAESGRALVWPDYPARDQTGLIQKREGPDLTHRTLY